METNRNADLTKRQKEIIKANFGLETIMVWVNKKAMEYKETFDYFSGKPHIQREVVDDFKTSELSRIKWSKHHSQKVRNEILWNAVATVTGQN
tara:strand:- start:49 stop:327 length:279 start_codon:yes stop_codon:yes gene_type:complete